MLEPFSIAQPERLIRDLDSLSSMTDPESLGWTRRAFTPVDVEGRYWIRDQMRAIGLDATIDGAGNVVGRMRGQNPSLGTLMTGSHTDTVEGGGRFDGNIGVISALEAIRTLRESDMTLQHDLTVVDFFGEEPNEFGISCVGSRALTGLINSSDLELKDKYGRQLSDKLSKVGIDPSALLSARMDFRNVKAFVELHIEQGPHLEEQSCDIGLVTSITGISRFNAVFTGRADHAGTTPMSRRNDAGCAAAASVLAVEKIASEGKDSRGTTGSVSFTPEAVNVVTAVAEMWGEFRSPNSRWLSDAANQFQSSVEAEGGKRSVEVELDWLPSEEPAAMDSHILNTISTSAERLGLKRAHLYSGAEHDAAMISRIVPTAMIFVPSADGRSHCPEEYTAESDIISGAEVLLNSLIMLDHDLA